MSWGKTQHPDKVQKIPKTEKRTRNSVSQWWRELLDKKTLWEAREKRNIEIILS